LSKTGEKVGETNADWLTVKPSIKFLAGHFESMAVNTLVTIYAFWCWNVCGRTGFFPVTDDKGRG